MGNGVRVKQLLFPCQLVDVILLTYPWLDNGASVTRLKVLHNRPSWDVVDHTTWYLMNLRPSCLSRCAPAQD